MMKKLIEFLWPEAYPYVVFIFALLTIMATIVKIFRELAVSDFLFSLENRKIHFLEEAYKFKAVDEHTRLSIKEKLNFLLFEKATGIMADSALRDKLIDIVEKSAREISIDQLAHVRHYLRMENGKLRVKITLINNAVWLINFFLVFYFLVLTILFFIGMPFSPSYMDFFSFMSFFVLHLIGFAFFLFQFKKHSTARKLQPIIEKLESSATQHLCQGSESLLPARE